VVALVAVAVDHHAGVPLRVEAEEARREVEPLFPHRGAAPLDLDRAHLLPLLLVEVTEARQGLLRLRLLRHGLSSRRRHAPFASSSRAYPSTRVPSKKRGFMPPCRRIALSHAKARNCSGESRSSTTSSQASGSTSRTSPTSQCPMSEPSIGWRVLP